MILKNHSEITDQPNCEELASLDQGICLPDETGSQYVAVTLPEINMCRAETGRLVPAVFVSPQSKAIEETTVGDILDVKLDTGIDCQFYKIQEESIYHIEFSSKGTQNDAFLRMSMFLESDVNAGRVLNDREVGDAARKYPNEIGAGYDFKIADVCNFYNKARKRGVKLNAVEEKIASDLVRIGLMRFNGGIFTPLQDVAIISAAQDSYARLSTIMHEYRHGLYMTDPWVRNWVKLTWTSLSKDQQSQMKEALRRLGNYDVKNEYLFLNELYANILDHTSTLDRMPYNDAGIKAFNQLETDFGAMEIRRRSIKLASTVWKTPRMIELFKLLEPSSSD